MSSQETHSAPCSYDAERELNPKPVELTISTRAPSKWRFVDMETREVYVYGPNGPFLFKRSATLSDAVHAELILP